jgi:polyribonucleotide nucleotidyltransferase
MVKKFQFDAFGLEVEIGKCARQANGAVWLKQGGTILIAAATEAQSKDFPGFLPLTVDYREQYSAAGKIPGGYYKREGKTTDREVLIARLVDRAIRPLFPANYFNQIQVIITVYSVDKEHAPDMLALLGASLALTISDIPFMGPVGIVQMGRIDGKLVVNPLWADSMHSDLHLAIAGTKEGICMVEGSCDELPEKEIVDVLFHAHEEIKKLVSWQEDVRAQATKEKKPVADPYQWNTWLERVDKFLTPDHVKGSYIADKIERKTYFDMLRETFAQQYAQEIETIKVPMSVIDYIIDAVLKEKLTDYTFVIQKRIDTRTFDKVRDIAVEVGLLPFTHGSALFTRGRTQALASVTLGSGEDAQRLENIMEEDAESGSFMLHYNFLPFSTGEVKSMRAPGRREVGHGFLAARSFEYMRPTAESFPYTIRIVVDILESDGSSSMATTCGATMALMQAGVPIKKMVGGIAMGLLKSKKDDDFVILSDISGIEDSFGLMDFKVTGTDVGVCAIQMDIKYKGGLTRDIFEKAFEQARKGRLFILGEMSKVMSKPNPELSDLVPKVETVKVAVDKIGAIIGGGGKTIREITEKTSTKIDIEPDGLVKIYGIPGANIAGAIRWVKTLAGQIERGSFYEGKIRRITDFGMFVELVPGHDGLVHVSNIPKEFQRTFMREYKVDDVVRVEVLDYDEATERVSLKLVKRVTAAPAQQ